MTSEVEKSLEYLDSILEKIPSSYSDIYKSILNTLTYINQNTSMRTRQNRFILDKSFYNEYIDLEYYKNLNTSEQLIYNCFKYCISNNIFNETSINYPFAKTITKINKYLDFLSEQNFWLLDKIDGFIESIQEKMKEGSSKLEESLFITLTILNNQKIKKHDLYQISFENSFVRKGILYLVFFDEVSNTDFIPFRVVKVNEEYSNFISYLLAKNGVLFKLNHDVLLDRSRNLIKEHFKPNAINRNILRQAVINRSIYKFETPVSISLKFQKIQTTPIILHELEALEEGSVPKRFLEIERKNINFKNEHNIADEFDDFEDIFLDSNGFDYEKHIEPLFYFSYKQRQLNLAAIHKNDFKPVYAETVIQNFEQAQKETDDESILIVIDFMLYYLRRVVEPKGQGIEFSTFKQYVSLIKSNFLVYYDDLNTIDLAKIDMLIGVLQRKNRSKSTITQITMLIEIMTKLDKSEILKNKLINAMPKSMVFDFELDPILNKIKQYYIEKAEIKKAKMNTKNFNYIILQEQVFVLLLFYTGLRKTELRTRLHKDLRAEKYDIYTGDEIKNGYTLYVNLEGIKTDKLSTRLKTGNSKRKVSFHIKNENHAIMVKKFLEQSKNNHDKYIFKEIKLWDGKKNLKIKKSAITYNNIEHINEIIKNVTNRYSSMHSLRASFATYKSSYILNNSNRSNTDLFNFSIEIGHQSPNITFKHYIHHYLYEEILWKQ